MAIEAKKYPITTTTLQKIRHLSLRIGQLVVDMLSVVFSSVHLGVVFLLLGQVVDWVPKQIKKPEVT